MSGTSRFTENGVSIEVSDAHDRPGAAQAFFNPQMRINRELVLCTLAAFIDEFDEHRRTKRSAASGTTLDTAVDRRIDCLDGFSATGIAACQWLHQFQRNLDAPSSSTNTDHGRLAVYASERQQLVAAKLRECAVLNDVHVLEMPATELKEFTGPATAVREMRFLQEDVSVVLLKKSFDFVHLDPFGSTAPYLETALRNLRQGGILSLSSTDASSLLARAPNVVWRNYGARVMKTCYAKELALRIILGSVVRAAARCSKGIRVLYAVAQEHFLLCAVQVVRGVKPADACAQLLQPLLHCRVCEQRVFLSDSGDEVAPLQVPLELLGCACHVESVGRTAALLGPCWAGALFCARFVRGMLRRAPDLQLDAGGRRVRTLLQLLLEEADCVVAGRACDELQPVQPAFYCSPARLKLHENTLPKLSEVVRWLQEAGFSSARTHFDLKALRSAASNDEMKRIILAHLAN